MKPFDVQSIAINAPFHEVFAFIATADNLPRWTSAFKHVKDGKALMQSPAGSVEVALTVTASRQSGTIDWSMAFPDGSVARAYSRVIDLGSGSCIYSFVLTAPPVALEQLEGALRQQSRILGEELAKLRQILEGTAN